MPAVAAAGTGAANGTVGVVTPAEAGGRNSWDSPPAEAAGARPSISLLSFRGTTSSGLLPASSSSSLLMLRTGEGANDGLFVLLKRRVAWGRGHIVSRRSFGRGHIIWAIRRCREDGALHSQFGLRFAPLFPRAWAGLRRWSGGCCLLGRFALAPCTTCFSAFFLGGRWTFMASNHGADGKIVLGIATADSDSLPVGSIEFHYSATVAGNKFRLSNFAGSCVDFVTQSSIESLRTNCMMWTASESSTGAAHFFLLSK